MISALAVMYNLTCMGLRADLNVCVTVHICYMYSGESGSIRLLVRLTEERILPSKYYKPLIEVLTDSVCPDKVSLKC